MSVKYFEPEEIVEHNNSKDMYMVINGKVYDVSNFADDHPGGLDIMLDYAGQDATKAYQDIGHSIAADELLEEMYIGDLKPGTEERLKELKKPRSFDNDTPPLPLLIALIVLPAIAVIVFVKLNK
ncbi:Cytochrome b5 [Schizosaccharomyces pombe]|uniref:Probable cytochrome b5 1 n=1 Tax=Schizosaccharomyces pombe (strain 972 / ATCC 24843) TaxID=284812 RepID=CYB51_SCHPO|nr:putative cytochrome b5 [Schizosaccharomyces pombe]O94391.1 RecName: Full=Probable cytochrome b5 1 [Schizosaccharomyces pombe 972h-]CAA22444.1 cytochrome b5 (predicted) [Schizosaccharomyces pombe]|eukprot:NP_596061.1 putative cytochrome b5 [Schizosaccharomyces pombe]